MSGPVLTDERCRFCGAQALEMHPAGVIADHWKCTRCGHRQDDVKETDLEGID